VTAPDCPDPSNCPVPDPLDRAEKAPNSRRRAKVNPLGGFPTVRWGKGRVVCRGYQLKWGYDSFNPGFGDTRFAPFQSVDGQQVPTLYLGENETAVLLESVFHDIHHSIGGGQIYEAIVRTWGVSYVELPADLTLVDLRNTALIEHGLSREELVSTTAEHYPCTRRWAAWFHQLGADGLVWHSRQSELHSARAGSGTTPAESLLEVCVLFGDRVPSIPGSFPLVGSGVRNLIEGQGRVLLDQLAEQLGARIEWAD
jgi:RES domain